ncbi:hypothetical protein Scep_014532 [Stephania cephalantha]|uniref:Uncharacterized protein n=1 Tax=Stephania cephalantha TaxID=152367 RepID=A0AAP0J405_9MAGN
MEQRLQQGDEGGTAKRIARGGRRLTAEDLQRSGGKRDVGSGGGAAQRQQRSNGKAARCSRMRSDAAAMAAACGEAHATQEQLIPGLSRPMVTSLCVLLVDWPNYTCLTPARPLNMGCRKAEQLSQKEDVQDITSIPLSYAPMADKLIWLPEKIGVYSVRSGYRVMEREMNAKEESSTSRAKP